jgi:hypothetical protein
MSTTIVNNNNPQLDAFDRLRVSNPFTLFDSSYLYKDNGKFDTSITGSGFTGCATGTSIVTLNIDALANTNVIRQSYKVFPYQPGKSLLVMNSFVMDTPKTNLVQRVGYFNSQNGVYFECDGTGYNMVLRSCPTGTSIQERRIYQSNWNIDTLTGEGESGIILDVTKSQLFIIDFEWLGVGSIRTGFAFNGVITYAHTFNNANFINSTYMQTATLPISYQIFNTGATSGSSTLKQICSTVLSEGGYQAKDGQRYTGPGLNLTLKTIAQAPTITAIASIRIKSERPSAIVIPSDVNINVNTTDTICYYLISNGTLGGTPAFSSYSTTSNVEVDTSATTVTGGNIIKQGFATSSNQSISSINISDPDVFNYQLGMSISGTSDVVTLAASSYGSTADIFATLGWYELN